MSFPSPTKRQARLIWLAATGLAMAVLVGLVAALVWGLSRALQILSPVLWPLAVAGVIAYLLDPVVDFFQKKGWQRTPAIVCVFALALVIVGGLFGAIVPQLVRETRQLVANRGKYAAELQKKISTWATEPAPVLHTAMEKLRVLLQKAEGIGATNAPSTSVSPHTHAPSPSAETNAPPVLGPTLSPQDIQAATDWLGKTIPVVAKWLFGQVGKVASWLGVLAGLALVPVYTFYFLLEKRGIASHWMDYLPVSDSSFKEELVFVLNSINNYLIAFFRGQVLVAISDGILYSLGFLLIGLPYALLIGAAAAVLTIIPFIGAIVVCCSALVIALVQYGDWLHPLLVLSVVAVVQTLEGTVISPKIMGDRVGLHPVSIIVAVMAGTTLLGGLLGGILAIPLTAALRVVMFRYVWKRRVPRPEPRPLEIVRP